MPHVGLNCNLMVDYFIIISVSWIWIVPNLAKLKCFDDQCQFWWHWVSGFISSCIVTWIGDSWLNYDPADTSLCVMHIGSADTSLCVMHIGSFSILSFWLSTGYIKQKTK
jgi:hypothetical protein